VQQGRELLRDGSSYSAEKLGMLMNQHHEDIRDLIGVSTPRIEEIRDAALASGALGAKIVGSGAGGCVVILAPGRTEEVIAAVHGAQGDAFAIEIVGGTGQ
jgi:galactokinase